MRVCIETVAARGSPDEAGETTLDAMVMDGQTQDIGAVGALRGVRDAAAAARMVLERTQHTLLVGDQATAFALQMGLSPGPANLSTPESADEHRLWLDAKCQPNYRRNVSPDPEKSCGPYRATAAAAASEDSRQPFKRASADVARDNHDTIAMFATDAAGRLFGATSTNGARGKIPGRVGDSPIPGAGLYVLAGVGGCGATGDGDVMMRFLPCYQAVESMRLGATPQQAAADAMAGSRGAGVRGAGCTQTLRNPTVVSKSSSRMLNRMLNRMLRLSV